MATLTKIPGNDKLVDMMKQIADDPSLAKREVYLRALAKARFIVPIEWTTSGNRRYRTLSAIYTASGQRFLLAFTDWQELFKWREEADERVVALSHEELKNQVMDAQNSYDGFVIDPYGVNLICRKQEILSSLPLVAPQTRRSAGREAVISIPRIYSQRLIGAIREELKSFYVVEYAHFLLMATEDGEKNYLLVLDFVGDNRRLFYRVSRAAQPYLKKNERLTIVSSDSNLGRVAIRGQKPFYTRSRILDIRAFFARMLLRIHMWDETRRARRAGGSRSSRKTKDD